MDLNLEIISLIASLDPFNVKSQWTFEEEMMIEFSSCSSLNWPIPGAANLPDKSGAVVYNWLQCGEGVAVRFSNWIKET